MKNEEQVPSVTLKRVEKLTEKMKQGSPMLNETISQIVTSVREPGSEDFHGLAAGMAVAIMLLQEQNELLKTQVSNLAGLVLDSLDT